MKKTLTSLFALPLFALQVACTFSDHGQTRGDKFLESVPAAKLYDEFRSPSSRSQLFVRWWWNGTRLEEREICANWTS